MSNIFKHKHNKKMVLSENLKFWIPLIVALIGALAWLPFLIEKCQKQYIEGKIISSYNNITEDNKQILFLFKLSIVSVNKDFLLKVQIGI